MSGTESARRVRRSSYAAGEDGEAGEVGEVVRDGELPERSCQTAQTYWKGSGRSLVIRFRWREDDLRVWRGGREDVVKVGGAVSSSAEGWKPFTRTSWVAIVTLRPGCGGSQRPFASRSLAISKWCVNLVFERGSFGWAVARNQSSTHVTQSEQVSVST